MYYLFRRSWRFTFIALLMTAFTTYIYAAPPADPYADAIDSVPTLMLNPTKVLGAPDGQTTTMLAGLGNDLILDLGAVRKEPAICASTTGGIAVALAPSVEFLNSNHTVLATGMANLVTIGAGIHSVDVLYTAAPTPYRYVRLKSLVNVYSLDAIEALHYVGQPTPTSTPTNTPTSTPTSTSTSVPTDTPTNTSTSTSTSAPTDTPTNTPTSTPTSTSTSVPTDTPTNMSTRTSTSTPINTPTSTPPPGSGYTQWIAQYGLQETTASPGADPDGDGLTNAQEYSLRTNPTNPDTDGDGLPDGWEVQFQLNPLSADDANGANGDSDGDGLTNAQEYSLHTNPTNSDTDGDGVDDGTEVAQRTNPLIPDRLRMVGIFLPIVRR